MTEQSVVTFIRWFCVNKRFKMRNFVENLSIMWQRKQTLFLGIALILVCLPFLGLPFFTYSLDEVNYQVTAFGNENLVKPEVQTKGYFSLMIIIALSLILSIISFKNRKRQLALTWISLILNLATAAWIIMMSSAITVECTTCETTRLAPAVGLYLFLAAFPFILLGYFGIRKDKKLIDSLNRLR